MNIIIRDNDKTPTNAKRVMCADLCEHPCGARHSWKPHRTCIVWDYRL